MSTSSKTKKSLVKAHLGKYYLHDYIAIDRQVYKAKIEGSDTYYALKRIKMDNEKEGVLKHSNITSIVSNYSNQRDQNSQKAESSQHH